MTDDGVVDEIVTKFLLNTCRLRPLSEHAVQAAVTCAVVASFPREENADVKCLVPLTTGSVAEFYIEPMLPHVGDVDIMHHQNSGLSIPRGHPPPSQLPAVFHNYVQVCEIIDSHLSGYVYLKLRYLLTKCTDSGWYKAIEYEGRHMYMPITPNFGFEPHGPARIPPRPNVEHLSTDLVPCVRCLSWPPQAGDWPTRHRNYSWPDSATADRVVGNGCDVVGVVHRQCRENEWMSKFQWRLSFSRAEIVLIKSWMPAQQIVYHMLRVFMKTERLTENADISGVCTLGNYHIKTLMLWACELKPKSWWTNDLSLSRICVELLHTLANWLTEARCPHYFINSCNLIDKFFASKVTASRLLLIKEEWLSSWFVKNYIRPSVQICPESVSRLFDDISTRTTLEDAVSAVADWRRNSAKADMFSAFWFAQCQIAGCVSVVSFTPWSCVCWMSELSKIDVHLSIYFAGVAFLHVAQKIERGGLINNLFKSLPVITSHSAVSNYCNEFTFSLLKKVLRLTGKCESPATNLSDCSKSELVELLLQFVVEFFTAFRHFEARNFGSVATIVTTDYEAMYAYKHGEYQRCLQLSTQNVRKLLYAADIPSVPTFPEFIQLLDDDIVSLTALTLIVDPECRNSSRHTSITQLTLSLCLITQCQLKLRHSLTSLTRTLDYIEVAQRRHGVRHMLNYLVLKSTKHKLVRYITTGSNHQTVP